MDMDMDHHAGATLTPPGQERGMWLFSGRVDLAVFLGSAILALLLLPLGAALGVLHGDAPEWTWIAAVLLIDVAHVWSTIFRVYLDREELARRFWLYILVPLCAYAVGVALYSESSLLFWRALAYMAVFHFVRQQYGWVILYRARVGELDRLGRALDTAVIYGATVFPLLCWHAHLPRAFWWFLPGDFAAAPAVLSAIVVLAEPIYWLLMAAYVARSAHLWLAWLRHDSAGHPASPARRINPGKDIVVLTTALCWYIGIVALNSDYAFTVTNVIIHGVPYMALIYWYGKKRLASGRGSAAMRVFARGPWLFLAVLWTLAYAEELLWDRAVWHERDWLFGGAWSAESLHVLLVPLLALPQATHYLLDGFIWRRRHNPELVRAGGFAAVDSPAHASRSAVDGQPAR